MTDKASTLTAAEVIARLQALGSESYKRIIMKHGVREPVLGVKISELKKLQKAIKRDHALACELYDTGIYDAQYLAGLIVDDAQMTKSKLRQWLTKANSATLCGYTVAWVAAESPHGWEIALEWIDSKKQNAAQTGWMTLASFVAVTDDADLNIPELKRLLDRIQKTIHDQPDAVRYAMNSFVIAAGCHVADLTAAALQAADKIGPVEVDMGETACKVPSARASIEKVQQRGTIGKKRKTAKC